MSYAILFVCTGNICRSPVAERLFTAGLRPGADVIATSAGTMGLAGHGIDGPSALALRELGVDPDGHAARRLTVPLLEAADLVLTASAEHRAVVLNELPLTMNRTFTLREFQRLAAALPQPVSTGAGPTPEELRARVGLVGAQRGQCSPIGEGSDDIADPFGASVEVARRSVAQIADVVRDLLGTLGIGR